jgi:hypothetical protein
MTNPPPTAPRNEPVYILITECLQNNFFVSTQNRLRIPEEVALRMLFSGSSDEAKAHLKKDDDKQRAEHNKLVITNKAKLKAGPLYEFFNSTVGSKGRAHQLHVLHVKDWHVPSENYDFERDRYGSHCEAGTWEAKPIDGFEEFLEPWATPADEAQAQSVTGFTQGNNTFYDIRSNSLFDFRGDDGRPSTMRKVMDRLILDQAGNVKPNAYVVVIGVLTDIKIKLLLTTLRATYALDNLVVSDVLTASSTLERHLSGLDFADKVLSIEIVHNLNALASVLYPAHPDDIPADTMEFHHNFRDYKSYYLDKQNILSYQDEKLLQYIELTRQRGADVYNHIFFTNRWLTRFGFGFLLITLLLGILRFIDPVRFPTEMLLVTGGLSTAQLIAVLINRPMGQIQQNLNNLVRLRNYLETYSTVTALLRHHLTIPERLQNNDIEDLKQQLALVQDMAQKMSANFVDIQLGEKEDKPDADA